MDKLLKEIKEGFSLYKEAKETKIKATRGKGTKSYVIKRIRLLREWLLDLEKSL